MIVPKLTLFGVQWADEAEVETGPGGLEQQQFHFNFPS